MVDADEKIKRILQNTPNQKYFVSRKKKIFYCESCYAQQEMQKRLFIRMLVSMP